MRHFLTKLKQAGVQLTLSGSELSVKFPKTGVDQELLREIKERKSEIIAFLQALEQKKQTGIPVTGEQEDYVLSSAQQRLWILSQTRLGNIAYNIPSFYVLEGTPDIAQLERAMEKLIHRHEILRTVFIRKEDGTVRQRILAAETIQFQIGVKDLRHEMPDQAAVKKFINQENLVPFDLEKGPLLRMTLFQVADNRFVLALVLHHIISDGWSMELLVREFLTMYAAAEGPFELEPLNIQYKDYAAWQRGLLETSAYLQAKEYWLDRFSGELPLLDFPSQRPRPTVKSYNGGSIEGTIPAAVVNQLKLLNKEEGTTLFMGILSVIYTFLHRYTNQEDFIIGTPIAGRDHADLRNQIGFYVNTLALRQRFSSEETFRELLQKVKVSTMEAYEHQVYPFDELVRNLSFERDAARSPLFDIMVVFQEGEMSGYAGNASFETNTGLKVARFEDEEHDIARFDLTFTLSESVNGLDYTIGYNSDIYEPAFMQQANRHFEQLFAELVSSSGEPLGAVEFLTEQEQNVLVKELNAAFTSYPAEKTIISLFEDQVQLTPDALALQSGTTVLTYRELNALANRFAAFLIHEKGAGTDHLIAINLERSEWLVIAILAVLKSGNAYVPLDPAYPEWRNDYIFSDSGSRLLINQDLVEEFRQFQGALSETNHGKCRIDQLAYLIYTSGTTGVPKGVMIGHSSAYSFVCWSREEFTNTDVTTVFGVTSVCFDLSIFELFYTLTTGKKLRLLNSALALPEALKEEHNSLLNTVPSVVSELLASHADLSGVKVLNMAGEPIPQQTIDALDPERMEIRNLYGPSEDTTYSTVYRIGADRRITIGKPITNTSAFVLNKWNRLCPAGVPGEICLGGEGLALGYMNKPELTVERFVPNPYDQNRTMYRTGDLGTWLPDGNLHVSGRIDDQVKVRGYRIETAEVEYALCLKDEIKEAVVVARKRTDGISELVAYIVTNTSLTITEVRSYIQEKLPRYMLPDRYIELDELPRTQNGKVDRKALPAADASELETGIDYVAPGTPEAALMLEVLESVLGKSGIGMRDNFFVLGGDSIKSIQIVSRLQQRGFELSIEDVLMYPVVEDLSVKMRPMTREIDQRSMTGESPLSPIQHAFLHDDQLIKQHYNQSILLCSKKQVDEQVLEACLKLIVQHHDALRLVYNQQNGIWKQHYRGPDEKSLFELVVFPEAEEAHFEQHCQELHASFNLQEGPLFKVLLQHGKEEDLVLLLAHHLVIDGVSWRIILEDLTSLYTAISAGLQPELPLKTDAFGYWVERSSEWIASVRTEQEHYWNQLLQKPLTPVPVDFPEGSNRLGDLTEKGFILSEEQTDQVLTKCYDAYKTEINDLLLAAFVAAAGKAFGQDRFAILMEGHGRDQINRSFDVSRTVGWFTSSFPVMLETNRSGSLVDQLIDVKETLHRIPDNGIGFGWLMMSGNQAFKAPFTFNYLGEFTPATAGDNEQRLFDFSGRFSGNDLSPERLRDSLIDISGMIVGGKLSIGLQYSKEQFHSATIDRLKDAMQDALLELSGILAATPEQHITPVDLSYKELSLDQVKQLNKDFQLEDVYMLSPLQQGIYFQWLLNPTGLTYCNQMVYTLAGDFDPLKLQKAYAQLVSRHAVLRTRFSQNFGDTVLQIVNREVKPHFLFRDESGNAGFSSEDFRKERGEQGYDLESFSPMRLAVVQLGNNTYEFVWDYHHIILDAWCSGILIREFFQIYTSLAENKPLQLPKPPLYSSYIRWLDGYNPQESMAFWKNYLQGYEPFNRIGRSLQGKESADLPAELSFTMDEKMTAGIRKFCSSLGITENNFVQVLWGILLGKYTGRTDIVFGSIVAGRPNAVPRVDEIIGMFINSIPVRIRFDKDISVKELMIRNQRLFTESSTHQYSQLAELFMETGLDNGIMDNMIVFQNFPVEAITEEQSDTKLVGISGVERVTNDLTFYVVSERNLEVRFVYNPLAHYPSQIAGIQQHLMQLIEQITTAPDTLIGELEYLDTATKEQLLSFAGKEISSTTTADVITGFEQMAELNGANSSLISPDRQLTYSRLNEMANQLAHYLIAEHDLPNTKGTVIVRLADKEHYLTAVIAIMKAGGAFLPVDPELPENRLAYIMEDSGCAFVIDEEELSRFQMRKSRYSKQNPSTDRQLTDLAYVIYTSGSTGKPKGVMVEHRSLVNMVNWHNETFAITAADRSSLFLNSSFDASLSEIFPYLCIGAGLVEVPAELRLDPSGLAAYFQEQGVTMSALPTRYAEQFMEHEVSSLRYLIVGGEKLQHYQQRNYRIVNQYGPTENTIVTTNYILEDSPDFPIPIGKPISNVETYVLDADMQLLPVGISGELYIGGLGVARGYMNNPELSAERFVAHPFREGQRLYRTGDICRWLPDGNLEYVGRTDDQVKVRGYRIELGEINNVIASIEGIADVATVVTDKADPVLVAYYCSEGTIAPDTLNQLVKQQLPAYMVPEYFVELDRLPVNANGKLDKAALPNPLNAEGSHQLALETPQTPTEIQLAAIWEDILNRKDIGRNSDFFELGGHSLRATRLSGTIQNIFSTKISISDLFANTTLQKQALLIDTSAKTAIATIPAAPHQLSYRLSSSQKRLWVICQIEAANIAYNISDYYLLKGTIEPELLEESFSRVIMRHESLRTVFREDADGDVRQFILETAQVIPSADIRDLRGNPDRRELVKELIGQTAYQPFDLAEGPLLRYGLYRLEEEEFVFSLTIHHIVSDGWSQEVMAREVLACYAALSDGEQWHPSPLTIQFKDYAEWQQEYVLSSAINEHKSYWQEQFSGELPLLSLPTDFQRPLVQTFNGKKISLVLNEQLTSELKAFCQKQGASLFMGLLSGLYTLLHRYSGQSDLIVGTPVAGREFADLTDQIGFYINTLPIRAKLDSEDSYASLVSKVKQTTLAAYEHQAYPFDDLVDALELKRDTGRSPLFDVLLVLQNTTLDDTADDDTAEQGLPDMERYLEVQDVSSKYELVFNVAEWGEQLLVSLDYNADIYSLSTATRLLGHFEQVLTAATAQPERSIDTLSFLTEEEQQLLVKTRNQTEVTLDASQTFVSQFEEQVSKTPDNTAFYSEAYSLTYKELNNRANSLAQYLLHNREVKPEELVAIKLPGRGEILVTMLAILKAGAAFVPLDYHYPEERVAYILSDCACRILIDEHLLEACTAQQTETTYANPASAIGESSLAYAIYTSGSTGKPKGVLIEHASLLNFCQWHNRTFDTGPADRSALYLNPAFDASLGESLPYLLVGAAVYEIPADIRLDVVALASWFDQHAITMCAMNTQFAEQFMHTDNRSLRCLIVGGDRLKQVKNAAYKIVNQYGPTECTVVTTNHFVDPESPVIPIGKPIANARLYILDDQLQLLPEGVAGELFIGGKSLSRGYLNLPEQTAEAFLPDPFVTGARMYRTGDICRWLPDGTVDYVGRKDSQLKIRGYRIELGEIESVLQGISGIEQAKVLIREEEDNLKQLVAVFIAEQTTDPAIVRNELRKQLPDFMVPALYIQLDEFPATVNGKIDEEAILRNNTILTVSGQAYVAPRNEMEEKLVLIWKEILGLEKIGVEDHFFEIGGHSIKAVKVVSEIQRTYEVRLDMSKIFHNPTIAGLAAEIENQLWQRSTVSEDDIVDKIIL